MMTEKKVLVMYDVANDVILECDPVIWRNILWYCPSVDFSDKVCLLGYL